MAPTTEPVLTACGVGRVVALTVDDGPGPDTPDLLDLLARLRVRATFCVVGRQVSAPGGADTLRRTVDEGHLLAGHGWDYDDLGRADAAVVEQSLRATLHVVRETVGEIPVPWYRAANGSWGVAAGVAVELGLQPLGVAGTVGDWETQDVDVLAARLRAAVTPGGLLLVHDAGGDRRGTVAALARVLPGLLADGWTFTPPEHPDPSVPAAFG